MITENLSTLKIHKLTQAQYDRELAAGRIDENALYLTPDDTEINQNAFSRVVVGSTTIEADSRMDSLTIDGSNVTITPDAANDKVVIGITKDNVTNALGYTPPTTDTTYSVATTNANGLLSSSDKKKLDGIASGANAYSLPTASSSTLGGVKTTSTVTSTSGLTACPIISGVPYYKDTKNTYNLSSFGVTATAAELNKLDGVTATTTEINYVDGVTSNIQTQLNGKANSSHTHSEYASNDHAHNEYASSTHTHSATDIASGTLSSNRLPVVPVNKGGTGANNAAGALINLGITFGTTDIGEGATLPTGSFYFVYEM